MLSPTPTPLEPYVLEDRYIRKSGRVFLTGTQALVRIMLDQAERDRKAGLNTAGFVSGYRGSPLGALDMEMWRAKQRLAEERITFMPAINEDLGATAIIGAQQAHLQEGAEVEGVFSMWYGKGPGVDRSGDALKHGNFYGTAPKGGVLVVAGDDHGCVSSSMPHQSDATFLAWFMPTINPASVEEYLEYGAYGLALSRYSSTWVGFKAISETVESARSVELPRERRFATPPLPDYPGGIHMRRTDPPSAEIETRMGAKLKAIEAFVEANPIDKKIYGIDDAVFGIVTTGKAHLDLMEALRLLGIDEAACRRLGIDIYKVGMVWPLARRDALNFVRGKKEVLVVEEKRGIIESQFKEYFYDWPGDKPERMVGKFTSQADEPLVPWSGELSPLTLVPIVADRLNRFFPDEDLPAKAERLTRQEPIMLQIQGANRTPYFCSGCPHNTSTKVPEGSRAGAGIGCHVMASWMDRNTGGFAQMGGEGVAWSVASQFAGHKHTFQNLGEGTWYHSGSMAIRQAIAAKANITYKILFNDAVAMTGGQPVDGPVSVQAIAHVSRAEGVQRIALVSDQPEKFRLADFPTGTTIHHRKELDPVQRELRQVEGVSVMIYEQTCATEKRRRRKRGTLEDPARFAFINPLVCEGCGDCSVESNCLSIEPMETECGRKRQVNLSTCNKDFSCLQGFCPSFVTIEGGQRRKKQGVAMDLAATLQSLPLPRANSLETPFDLLVTGVGGTGVVTVGALITMAAHLEGKGASVLDFTGFAQKFGPVLSYIRLADHPTGLNQVRIDTASADALIGCDAVVSASPKASVHYRAGTQVVLNMAAMPTGDIVLNRDADLKLDARRQVIAGAVGNQNLASFDANATAETLLGDSVFANVMMLGYAWQRGLVPLGEPALKQAIVLNGVAAQKNALAFDLGRLMAAKPEALSAYLAPSFEPAQALDAIIDQRAAFLADYQNEAYGQRYRQTLAEFTAGLADTRPAEERESLSKIAAKALFKLMAYKDEYEVARLHTQTGFEQQVADAFEGDYRIHYHMAPPLLSWRKDARGRPVKRQFGPWLRPALAALARLKGLRGGPLDLFGYREERRLNRALIGWYEDALKAMAQADQNVPTSQLETIAMAPLDMRGYGPVWMEAAQKQRALADAALSQI